MIKYSIEDEVHAEWQGDYASFGEALSELKRRSTLPWHEEPNRCPCTGWQTCERTYVIQKYDVVNGDYLLLSEDEVLSVSSKGVIWSAGFEPAETRAT